VSGRVLIVDDDEGFARGLERVLRRAGHDVFIALDAASARAAFATADADAVVLDYQLPDADGLVLLDELRPSARSAVFLIATAYPSLEIAVDAMRRGAFDYVAKGADVSECVMRIERGIEVALLRRRMAEASRSAPGADTPDLIGESAAMRALRDRLDALAGADQTTVFLEGETGVGKGVVSRAIHARSGRAYEPFVAVDCTTIPATLVESELFGYDKGAFSGATSSKQGRVEAAGRGTLFLDEIGELEPGIQGKLLRLLEEREYVRVGGTEPRRLTARVITATNRDHEAAVAAGRFRPDLRYRLEVFVVPIPPLRERGDDVFLLAAHFIAERARALGRREPRLSDGVVRELERYPFPGNVRELRNMIEQAILLARGDALTLDDFPVLAREARGGRPATIPPSARPPSVPPASAAPGAAPQSLDAIRARHAEEERRTVVEALDAARGNVAEAARRLGLSRFQLLRRLSKHRLR
jgi:DNA-binding NtrC family response regulator